MALYLLQQARKIAALERREHEEAALAARYRNEDAGAHMLLLMLFLTPCRARAQGARRRGSAPPPLKASLLEGLRR